MMFFSKKVQILAGAISLLFLDGCGESSSPNNANPVQEKVLSEEPVDVEISSSSSVEEVVISSADNSVDEPTTPTYSLETGTIIDERDGRIYRTVTIGSQTWMAENLKFEYKIDGVTYGNSCAPESCETFGRHYTWAAAMDSAGVFSNYSENCGYDVTCSPIYPVSGICPDGWHVPDSTEWVEFYKILNEDPHAMQTEDFIRSQKAIKAGLVATNASGFSALFETVSLRSSTLDGAFFWSSTEIVKRNAYFWHLTESDARLDDYKFYEKNIGMAVRCIKNSFTVEIPSSSSAEDFSDSSSEISADIPVVTPPVDTVETENILIDERDGQSYKTIVIGSQTWMAKNLNYEINGSDCYGGSSEYDNCAKYGRLYTLEAARKACPSGYHLPSKAEWQELISVVGGVSIAGKMLKSKSGWGLDDWNGTDAYGFSALPAGYGLAGNGPVGRTVHDYYHEGFDAYFWSSSIDGGSYDWNGLDLDSDGAVRFDSYYEFDLLSVRCILGVETKD